MHTCTNVLNTGVSTRALFVDIQEHVHRKVMELDFFAPWILSHGLIHGIYMCYVCTCTLDYKHTYIVQTIHVCFL